MMTLFQLIMVTFFVIIGLFNMYLAGKYKAGYESKNTAKDSKYYVISAIILLTFAVGIWLQW